MTLSVKMHFMLCFVVNAVYLSYVRREVVESRRKAVVDRRRLIATIYWKRSTSHILFLSSHSDPTARVLLHVFAHQTTSN